MKSYEDWFSEQPEDVDYYRGRLGVIYKESAYGSSGQALHLCDDGTWHYSKLTNAEILCMPSIKPSEII